MRLSQFNISKTILLSRLRRNYASVRDKDDPFVLECTALLHRSGDEYTPDELGTLFGLVTTAHDCCVLDNPDEYTQIERWVSRRNFDLLERLERQLKVLAASSRGADGGKAEG